MNSSVTKQPLISVIVPVYNIIPYLPRCVESLQKQIQDGTYQPSATEIAARMLMIYDQED